jgi:hypothetical protein
MQTGSSLVTRPEVDFRSNISLSCITTRQHPFELLSSTVSSGQLGCPRGRSNDQTECKDELFSITRNFHFAQVNTLIDLLQ